MKVIVGLGNIGPTYEGTRHNVGFMALDAFAAAHGLTWQTKDKFKADVAEGYIGAERVILIKPATYYNLSGESVMAVAQFYKVEPQNIAIVHDELALPLGTVRTRIGGSDAGNNGLKSIAAHIGTETARIRIGVATHLTAKQDAADVVLGRFSHQEREQLLQVQKYALEYMRAFITGDFSHATAVV